MCYIVLHEIPLRYRRRSGASPELERVSAARSSGRHAESHGAPAYRGDVGPRGLGKRVGAAHRRRPRRARQGQSCRARSSARTPNAGGESRIGGHARRSAVAGDRLSRRVRHRQDHHAGARIRATGTSVGVAPRTGDERAVVGGSAARAQTDPCDGCHAAPRSTRPRTVESHPSRSRYSAGGRRVPPAGVADIERRAPRKRPVAWRRSRSRHDVRSAARGGGTGPRHGGACSGMTRAPGRRSR